MTRVAISFDDESLAALERLRHKWHMATLGQALAECVRRHEVVLEQAEQGFSDLQVHNRYAGLYKSIILPSVVRMVRRKKWWYKAYRRISAIMAPRMAAMENAA